MNTPNENEVELSIIQQTDVDAKLAKRSAVELGYLQDPFIARFAPEFIRKSPVINRGASKMWPAIDFAQEPMFALGQSTVLSKL